MVGMWRRLSRVRVLGGWTPTRRISALVYLHRGSARFRLLIGTRSWSILLVRRDPSVPAAREERLPTVEAAVAAADARWAEIMKDDPGIS